MLQPIVLAMRCQVQGMSSTLVTSGVAGFLMLARTEDPFGQGRIKVRGGPRLDTVMGPYPSFISYHRLRTLRV